MTNGAAGPRLFRLSPQQRHYWRLRGASQGQDLFAACIAELSGPLDRGRLYRAVDEVVQDHEILRTVLRDIYGVRVPVQAVLESLSVAWSECAVSASLSVQDAMDTVRRTSATSMDTGLWACLMERDSESHLLGLVAAGLRADGLSMINVVAAIAAAYGAAREPDYRGVSLERIQYATAAEVFNDSLESPDGTDGQTYWVQNVEVTTRLNREGRAARITRFQEIPLSDRVRELIRAEATTASVPLATVLLTCWALVLQTGLASEVEIGVAFDGRTYDGLQEAIGPFVRYLPVKFQIGGSFRELTGVVSNRLAECERYQDYFDPSARDGTECGGLTAGYEAVELPEGWSAGGISFRVATLQADVEACDIRLSCVSESGKLSRLVLTYDETLFSAAAVERIGDRLLAVSADALSRPQAQVETLCMMPNTELKKVLDYGCGGAIESPVDTIPAGFSDQVQRTPERLAVTCNKRAITYAVLNDGANRIARMLRGYGVRPEVRVGLLMDRSPDALTALLAILKAGGVVVPLEPMYPADRLKAIAEDASLALVVSQLSLRSRHGETFNRMICLDDPVSGLDAFSSRPIDSGLSGANAAYAIYTSGSTGRPKGVVVSHRAVINLWAALRSKVYPRGKALRVSLNAPLTFDASVKQWIQLLGGHTVRVISDEDRLDAPRMIAGLQVEPLDVLDCTPTQLRALVSAGLSKSGCFPPLVLCGGEAMDEALWEEVKSLSGTVTINLYGPTECTVDATAALVSDYAKPTIGHPLGGTAVYLLDGNMRAVPIGSIGEICLGGVQVARGYLGAAGRTADKFTPDPFSATAGARLYRTGDLARWSETGDLEYIGRADGQVKVRGVRLELGEIEAIARGDPRIQDCVAAVVTVDGERSLGLWFTILDTGEPVDQQELEADLRRRLRERLPEFMMPAVISRLEGIPRTPGGKADRQRLAVPPKRRVVPGGNSAVPQTERQLAVAAIWESVLGVNNVGVHDNFFDLGGNSLLLVRVYERLRSIAPDLTLVDMFRLPTVALLAERLDASSPQATDPLSGIELRARRQQEILSAAPPAAKIR